MNASQSMTVARRLTLGFGLIVLVLIAMVTVTLVGLSTINQQIYEITQINALQGRLATKMVDAAQEMRVQYRQMLLDTDPVKDSRTHRRGRGNSRRCCRGRSRNSNRCCWRPRERNGWR